MEVFLGFLICTLLIGLGISIGVAIEATKSLKKLGEIKSGYKREMELADAVIENLNNINREAKKLIALYEEDLDYICNRLVLLRDKDGVDGLDGLIGHIGRVLSDEPDSKEESNG